MPLGSTSPDPIPGVPLEIHLTVRRSGVEPKLIGNLITSSY